jgi:hypothetical protein
MTFGTRHHVLHLFAGRAITAPFRGTRHHVPHLFAGRAITFRAGSTAVLPRALRRRVSSGQAKSDGAFADLMQEVMARSPI